MTFVNVFIKKHPVAVSEEVLRKKFARTYQLRLSCVNEGMARSENMKQQGKQER